VAASTVQVEVPLGTVTVAAGAYTSTGRMSDPTAAPFLTVATHTRVPSTCPLARIARLKSDHAIQSPR